MKNLILSPDLSLPLNIIVMRIVTYGDSGAGKTTFARLLAEKVHEAGQRFCAIDLKNDWWGLKSSADGAKAGLPIIIVGGPRADVKLFIPDKNQGGAEPVARSLAQTVTAIDQSLIIDLDGFSRGKQELFLAPFLDALYEASRKPLLLFCDEADRYAPQKPMSQEALNSLSSSEDIARRGRKRGIGSFWLTQRTAVLNKNVSEFANLTAIFRTPGEKDLNELEDRVGRIASKIVVKEVMKMAPGLADGEAIFLSAHPKLRKFMPDPVRPIQLPLPWTFDSSATPNVGQRKREPKVLAQTDLAAIEAQMQQQVEAAKANDPKLLKAELAKLKQELARATATPPKSAPAPQKLTVKRVEIPVIRHKELQRLESALTAASKIQNNFVGYTNSITESLDTLRDRIYEAKECMADARREGEPAPLIESVGIKPVSELPLKFDHGPKPAPARPRPVPKISTLNTDAGENGDAPLKLSPLAQSILDAIAWWNAAGVDQPTRDQTAFVAGVASGGGSGRYFTDQLSILHTAGLIDYFEDRSDRRLGLTDAGRAKANAPEQAPTYNELLDRTRQILRLQKHLAIFNALVKHGPMEREALATAAQFKSAGRYFTDQLSILRSAGVIDYAEPNTVTLSSAFDANGSFSRPSTAGDPSRKS